MRVGRIALDNGTSYAVFEGERAQLFSDAPWQGGKPTGREVALAKTKLLAPAVPYKILCVGRNYAAHAQELGNEVPKEPLLFLKPKSAIIGPRGTVQLPRQSHRVEHEAELAVVIGRSAKNVASEQAHEHVYGYTCACDVTARDLQKQDGQWSRAKGFDTFCPLGPWIETELEPGDLAIRCRVNGALRQNGRTSQMLFDVATLIAYASQAMTLEPGDVLLTGTPSGVGPLGSGDNVDVEIDGIGHLVFAVA